RAAIPWRSPCARSSRSARWASSPPNRRMTSRFEWPAAAGGAGWTVASAACTPPTDWASCQFSVRGGRPADLEAGIGRPTDLASGVLVDEHVRDAHHVLPDGGAVRVAELLGGNLVEGRNHQFQPTIAGGNVNGERVVAHPQSRMAALDAVILRAAPVLLEEHPEPGFRALPVVVGVHRAEDVVLGDAAVKTGDHFREGCLADFPVKVAEPRVLLRGVLLRGIVLRGALRSVLPGR